MIQFLEKYCDYVALVWIIAIYFSLLVGGQFLLELKFLGAYIMLYNAIFQIIIGPPGYPNYRFFLLEASSGGKDV